MARTGIKKSDVFNAAEAIRARGTEPTMTAIRVELGSTGSLSTISQHLSAWREETAEKVQQHEIPEEVQNKMLEALTVVWGIASSQAQQDIKAIKQEYSDKLKHFETDRRELEKVAIKQEQEGDKNLKTLESTFAALEKEREKTRVLELELNELRGQVKIYQQLVKQPDQKLDKKKAHPKPIKASS